MAVLEHRQRQRDDTRIQHTSENIAGAGRTQPSSALPQLRVASVRRVRAQAITQRAPAGQRKQPDSQDRRGRRDEHGVQEAAPGRGQRQRGEVGQHADAQLRGHGVRRGGGVVDGKPREHERQRVDERVEVGGGERGPGLGAREARRGLWERALRRRRGLGCGEEGEFGEAGYCGGVLGARGFCWRRGGCWGFGGGGFWLWRRPGRVGGEGDLVVFAAHFLGALRGGTLRAAEEELHAAH